MRSRMKKVTLAWAEDNRKFREGVSKLVLSNEDWLDLIFVADNGIQLLNWLETQRPDIVLMDIRMPEMDGIETTKTIREKYPALKIIAFTEFDYEENIVEMNKAGVKSFVAKSEAQELVRAIKIVSEGGVYFPDEVAEILQKYIKRTTTLEDNDLINYNKLKFDLSPQERKLIQLLIQGKTSKEIALQLNLTVKTISTYRERLLKKTNTKNVAELLSACCKIKPNF